MSEVYSDIFQYITRQEAAYQKPIPLNSKTWGMQAHIARSVSHRDSDIVGKHDINDLSDFTPIKNITRPILNLEYRTEDIDVKDVDLYVNDKDKYHLSFLIKKYHDDVYTQEHDLDTFFDELNQSRIDFGAGLSKDLGSECPEVVPLQSIAFCDQTDLLSGPIGIKHYYSPDQLLAMEKVGWGNKANGATASLKDLIALSREQKQDKKDDMVSDTPGRYIEVYEVHGNLPKKFADSQDDSNEYETRLFIVAFYQKKNSMEKFGITLYSAPEQTSPFKLIKRDPVFGRALGFGGAEELFDSQIWVNYDMIRKQDMLDAASKTILKASGVDSSSIANKNKVRDMDNLQVIDVGQGDLAQVDTFPRNIRLFDASVMEWETHAKNIGAAQDPIQGIEPTAGTPFASLQAQIQQGMGLHDYRRGIFAKHLEEIYIDWIIPHIQKKICQGTTFLSELSLEELQYVGDCLVRNEANKFITERILNGEVVAPEEVDAYKQQVREEFKRKGNKHFIEILKNEFKDVPIGVKVSIAGKSKNLGKATDAIVNILRFVVSTNSPALGFAGTWELINQVIEQSGLNPVDFSGLAEGFKSLSQQAPQLPPGQPQASPMQPQQPAYGK